MKIATYDKKTDSYVDCASTTFSEVLFLANDICVRVEKEDNFFKEFIAFKKKTHHLAQHDGILSALSIKNCAQEMEAKKEKKAAEEAKKTALEEKRLANILTTETFLAAIKRTKISAEHQEILEKNIRKALRYFVVITNFSSTSADGFWLKKTAKHTFKRIYHNTYNFYIDCEFLKDENLNKEFFKENEGNIDNFKLTMHRIHDKKELLFEKCIFDMLRHEFLN